MGTWKKIQPKEDLKTISNSGMEDYGKGFCKNNYIRGWDGKGIKSREACNDVCMAEEDCTYAAWYPNRTCSRYNGKDCKLNSDKNHYTWKKIQPKEDLKPIVPASNSTEPTKDDCDKLKIARKLNKDLLKTLEKLENKMDNHANHTSERAGKIIDIDNTYSKFPVNNSISYKKFLHKIEASYQTGYYEKQLKKLEKCLKNFKFDKNIVAKCDNQNNTFVPPENTDESEGMSDDRDDFGEDT